MSKSDELLLDIADLRTALTEALDRLRDTIGDTQLLIVRSPADDKQLLKSGQR